MACSILCISEMHSVHFCNCMAKINIFIYKEYKPRGGDAPGLNIPACGFGLVPLVPLPTNNGDDIKLSVEPSPMAWRNHR